MKKMYQKVIACTIVVAQLLSLFTVVGFADLGEQHENVSDTSTQAVYGTYGITTQSFNLQKYEVALLRYKFSCPEM